ncbi:MAG: hypothetical protein M3071_07655 [Actinomycetota bacterium]|nr:hypothetical protein [Actinomycetota bacterium]
MKPDARFTREIADLPGHRLEVGVATWDEGNEMRLSVRHYVPNKSGRFDPYSSGEVPIEFIGPMADLVREYLQHR